MESEADAPPLNSDATNSPPPPQFCEPEPLLKRLKVPDQSPTTYGSHSPQPQPQPLEESEADAPPTTYGSHSPPHLFYEYYYRPPNPLEAESEPDSPPDAGFFSASYYSPPPDLDPQRIYSPQFCEPEPLKVSDQSPTTYGSHSPSDSDAPPPYLGCYTPPRIYSPEFSEPEPVTPDDPRTNYGLYTVKSVYDSETDARPIAFSIYYTPEVLYKPEECQLVEPPIPVSSRDSYRNEEKHQLTVRKAPVLCGRIGIHSYNLHTGTNFHFLSVHGFNSTGTFSTYTVLEAKDPLRDSTAKFTISSALFSDVDRGFLKLNVTCRMSIPMQMEEELHSSEQLVDVSVDAFFKGDMPNWLPEYGLTGSDKLQYHEMEESEVQEEKEWLLLYAELAIFAAMGSSSFLKDKPTPLELGKIIVQTREDVESKKKAKARNAIFYISFKSSGGQDHNAIIRRTMAETPHPMSLEVICRLKSSSV